MHHHARWWWWAAVTVEGDGSQSWVVGAEAVLGGVPRVEVVKWRERQ